MISTLLRKGIVNCMWGDSPPPVPLPLLVIGLTYDSQLGSTNKQLVPIKVKKLPVNLSISLDSFFSQDSPTNIQYLSDEKYNNIINMEVICWSFKSLTNPLKVPEFSLKPEWCKGFNEFAGPLMGGKGFQMKTTYHWHIDIINIYINILPFLHYNISYLLFVYLHYMKNCKSKIIFFYYT